MKFTVYKLDNKAFGSERYVLVQINEFEEVQI